MLSYVWYLHIPAAGFKGGIGRFGGARDERLPLGMGFRKKFNATRR